MVKNYFTIKNRKSLKSIKQSPLLDERDFLYEKGESG